MPTTLESVVTKYLRSGNPAQRTREEYATTLRKWSRWGGAVPLERLGRKEIREFLDWVHEDASTRNGSNPGRTANKVRSHLRAVLSWAWEHWDRVRALDRPVGYLYRVGRTAVRRSAPRPIVDARVSTTTEIPDVQPELLAALAALPGQQQTVVLLVEAYGWSQQEVADVLGISPSTVHAHLRRALDRLRHTLEASSDAI